MEKYRVVIIGAGSGGLSVASKLSQSIAATDIVLIDPSEYHYYQPYWTLVGAGVGTKEETRKPLKDLLPEGVEWIQDSVIKIDPVSKTLALKNSESLEYEFLIVAPGLRLAWEKVTGLTETLGKNSVCSIYEYDQIDYVQKSLLELKSGKAIFVMPPTPIKCAGAPQKIMYLAENIFRNNGVRKSIEVHFASAGKAIFGVPEFAKSLDILVQEKNIKTHFQHKLISVNGEKKIAQFEVTGADGQTRMESLSFDVLHVVPPMVAHDFINDSGLAVESGDQKGWLAVDKETLQHLKYPNIFGLGDVTGVPNSKTGAAIRKQYPVVARNLIEVMKGLPPSEKYDGYSSCPLIVEFGKVILAEFGYDGKLMPTFPIDQTQPSRLMWILKRYLLPIMYWSGMIKGKA